MTETRRGRPCRRAVDPTPELRDFDPLTGLAVRSLFQSRLEQQWKLCRDGHRPLGLLLIDFDKLGKFKAQNHKSLVASALSDAADVVRAVCRRRADLATRVRSGEFAVILSDVDCDGTRELAETIRRDVQALQIPVGYPKEPAVLTVSIGAVCAVPPPSHFPQAMVIACDHALRDAKDDGGNCVGLRCSL